ncbi:MULTISPECIES: type II toxin-antitoxin system prevent-host-death family antitoxin [Corynebacterium]|uniref:Antitoxin n=1 Tax=Corynebacterium phoceense TaxID=1686286 RepID=A0A540R6D4_9CORY|nr:MULTISPECIES: type II toxin-antitoxin system prevent-host-death family antitoxin [Corynebacterium]TQE43300.1 type II toxin-antitoxin system prevent-host-death family antitoxin [Corynebacterium phoceense]
MQREHRDELGVTIDESRFTGKRTIVTRNGKRVAAIVPVSDLERLEELAMEADVAAFDEARRADDGKRIPWRDIRDSSSARDGIFGCRGHRVSALKIGFSLLSA